MIQWWMNRSPHELDVIRTIATVVGGGLIPLLGLLMGWAIKILRRTMNDARMTKEQTAHTEYVDGVQRSVPVVDYARHAAHGADRAVNAGEASRQETADLAVWVKGDGKRRLHTSELSLYLGEPDPDEE